MRRITRNVWLVSERRLGYGSIAVVSALFCDASPLGVMPVDVVIGFDTKFTTYELS